MLSADVHDNNVLTMFNVLNGFKKRKIRIMRNGEGDHGWSDNDVVNTFMI